MQQELWLTMVRRSFNPRQWFMDDEDPREAAECLLEETIMWVYRRTESGTFTVGFYDPDRRWNPEGDYPTRTEAAARVHWLNGGGEQDRATTVQEAARQGYSGT